MKLWKTNVSLLAAIGLMILVDQFAWKIARLERYIGRAEGITGAVDQYVNEQLRPSLNRAELERKLQEAKGPEEYGEVGQALFELLGEMGKTTEQRELMLETVKLYGRENDPNIVLAHEFLAKYYLKTGRKTALGKTLARLREVAEGPPTDGSLLQDVVRWAKAGGLDEFFVETAERAHTLPGLQPEQRLSIVMDLVQYHRKRGDRDGLAKAKKFESKYRKLTNVGKIVVNQAKKISAYIKKKKVDDAFALLRDTTEKYPEFARRLLKVVVALIKQANTQKKTGIMMDAWKLAAGMGPLPPRDKNLKHDIPAAAQASMSALLLDNRFDAARMISAISDELAPGGKSYEYFFKGEEWARKGRKGPCPKVLYRIAYRPDAKVNIDGRLDEDVWAGIKTLPGPFWVSFDRAEAGVTEAGELKLEARIFFTDKVIMVGVKCPEPFMLDLKRNLPAGPSSNCWTDDCVEFFIGYNRTFSYRQFVATAGGAYYQYFLNQKKPKVKSDSRIITAAAFGDNAYMIEFSVPLDLLPVNNDLHGKLVNGSLRRNRWLSTQMAEQARQPGSKRSEISWSRMGGGSHGYELMDFMLFE